MRMCRECGKLMLHEGYCIKGGAAYYCSDECLHKHITPEEWKEMYTDGGDSYWTTWEEPYNGCNLGGDEKDCANCCYGGDFVWDAEKGYCVSRNLEKGYDYTTETTLTDSQRASAITLICTLGDIEDETISLLSDEELFEGLVDVVRSKLLKGDE